MHRLLAQWAKGRLSSTRRRWRMDRRRMRCCTAQEIFELAAKGNVLIRGWGPVYLLRSVQHVLSVRICATMEFREAVLMQRLRPRAG
jgi:hypothetical protein